MAKKKLITYYIYSIFSVRNTLIDTIKAKDKQECLKLLVNRGCNPKELKIETKEL